MYLSIGMLIRFFKLISQGSFWQNYISKLDRANPIFCLFLAPAGFWVLSSSVCPPQSVDAAVLQRHDGHPGRGRQQHQRQPHEPVKLCLPLRCLPDCAECGHLRRTLRDGAGGGESLRARVTGLGSRDLTQSLLVICH